MRIFTRLVAAVILTAAILTAGLIPAVAQTPDLDPVSCVQQGLLDAGHDPNGVDGKLGGGTMRAAEEYLGTKGSDTTLPPLSAETAEVWCAALTNPAEPPTVLSTDATTYLEAGTWSGTWEVVDGSDTYSGDITYTVTPYGVRVSVNNKKFNWTFKSIEVLDNGTMRMKVNFGSAERTDTVSLVDEVAHVTYVHIEGDVRTFGTAQLQRSN